MSHEFFNPISDLWDEISNLRHPPFPDPSPSRLRHDMTLDFDNSTDGSRSTKDVEVDASLRDVARMFREQHVDVTWPKIISEIYGTDADEDSDVYEDASSDIGLFGEDDDFAERRMEALLVKRTRTTVPSESGRSDSLSFLGDRGASTGRGVSRRLKVLNRSPSLRPVSRRRTATSGGSPFFEEIEYDRVQPQGSPLAAYYEKFDVKTEGSSTPCSDIVKLSDFESFLDLESIQNSPSFVDEPECVQAAPLSPVPSPVPSVGRLSISGAISIHSLALNIEEHLYLVDADAALFPSISLSSPVASPNASFIRSPTNLSGLFSFYSPRLGTIAEEATAKPQQHRVTWHSSTYERPPSTSTDRTLRRVQRLPLNPNRQTDPIRPLVISQPFPLIAKSPNSTVDDRYLTMQYEGAHIAYRRNYGSTTLHPPLSQPRIKWSISRFVSKLSKGFKKAFICGYESLDNIDC